SGTDLISWPIFEDASIDLNYGNQTFSAQWRRIISDQLYGTLTATGSRYFNEPEFQLSGTSFESENNVHDFSLKGDLEYTPNEHHTVSAGFWGGAMTLRLKEVFDNEYASNRRLHSRYVSAYIQERWQPTQQWIATGGLRLNTFSKGSYLRLAPRLSVEHRPTETIRLQAAYGRYNQFLTLMTNEAFSGFDTWLTTAKGVPPSYGDQFSLGIKTNPFEGYGFDVEVYYRTMKDLFELDPFISDNAGLDYEEQFRFGEGYAYGMEVFLEKNIGRLSGFAGYTFGITRRKFPGFNVDIPENPRRGRFYPPKYDRTHDMNIVARYRLSQRWQIAAVFNYSTGQAYTDPQGRTQFSHVPWGGSSRDAFVVGNVNASRLPSYHRLDISFSRSGRFFDLGDAEWKFQLINLYNRSNIWFYNYDFDENPVKREDVSMLPILPAVSYTVDF
ncbi:MAG TPA: TonB-dependent receptor, partial [Fodinibius sp.]|nr:TonB-dependent receptor [Fodinibius sp.]